MEDNILGPPQGSLQHLENVREKRCLSLTTLLGFLRAGAAAGTGGEKQTFFFGAVAVGRGVGRLGAGGFGAGGFGAGDFGAGGTGGNGGLPLRGGS